MRDIADKAQPVTGANYFGAEFSQAVMGDDPSLEIADVVGRVVHELQVTQPAPMRFLEPFELALEEVEAFRVRDDRRIARLVRGFKIGRGEGAANAVMGDQLVDPRETLR